MFNNLVSAFSDYIMFIVLGAFFVLMIVMTIIPQRKQKKKMQEMMNSIQVGDKIMTIGGFIGIITEYDAASDGYVINIGTEEAPVNVSIIKNAIRTKM